MEENKDKRITRRQVLKGARDALPFVGMVAVAAVGAGGICGAFDNFIEPFFEFRDDNRELLAKVNLLDQYTDTLAKLTVVLQGEAQIRERKPLSQEDEQKLAGIMEERAKLEAEIEEIKKQIETKKATKQTK